MSESAKCAGCEAKEQADMLTPGQSWVWCRVHPAPMASTNTSCIRSIPASEDHGFKPMTEFVSAAGVFEAPSWAVARVVGEATTERVRDMDLGPVTEAVLYALRVDGSPISDLAHAVVWCDIMGSVDRAVARTF